MTKIGPVDSRFRMGKVRYVVALVGWVSLAPRVCLALASVSAALLWYWRSYSQQKTFIFILWPCCSAEGL